MKVLAAIVAFLIPTSVIAAIAWGMEYHSEGTGEVILWTLAIALACAVIFVVTVSVYVWAEGVIDDYRRHKTWAADHPGDHYCIDPYCDNKRVHQNHASRCGF